VPEESEYVIGVWGYRQLAYLKTHKRTLYVNLLTSGELTEHLREIDATANERQEVIIKQMSAAQGVTERLKAENQMLWVGKVNNIHACTDEIFRSELIYS
jgi:hypothetical protein